jgi:hypothetical protein
MARTRSQSTISETSSKTELNYHANKIISRCKYIINEPMLNKKPDYVLGGQELINGKYKFTTTNLDYIIDDLTNILSKDDTYVLSSRINHWQKIMNKCNIY